MTEIPICRQSNDLTDDPKYLYATIQKPVIPKTKDDSDNSSIDTPKVFFKSTNAIPGNHHKPRIERKVKDKIHLQKVKTKSSSPIGVQSQCTNSSPDLEHLKEFPISEKNKFINPPFIRTESDRSSICSVGSDDLFQKDHSLPNCNMASSLPPHMPVTDSYLNTSPDAQKEPIDELSTSVEDQFLKIQNLNIEQIPPGKLEFFLNFFDYEVRVIYEKRSYRALVILIIKNGQTDKNSYFTLDMNKPKHNAYCSEEKNKP